MSNALTIVTAISTWIVVIMLFLSYRKQKKIHLWAQNLRKQLEIIQAMKSGRLTDLLKAADMDPNDPMFRDMPLEEAIQVIQVRVADKLRRMQNER